MPSSNFWTASVLAGLPAVLAGLPAVLAGAVFLYIASSPWLVWHTLPESDHKLVIFSPHIPALPDFAQAQYFTSLPERWLYVASSSSFADWKEAVVTLSVRPVPLHPAGLLESPRWFGEQTMIMATLHGKKMHLLARTATGETKRYARRLDTLTAEDVLLEVPGAALVRVPQVMHDAWNRRLHQTLGFTATAPDILKELSQYDRVFMTIKGQESAVGIANGSADQAERWRAASEAWAVEEDRFRRPRETTFRLPDRSLGRETLAGLPREVFTRDAPGSCAVPLPDAPALYSCQTSETLALANYAWSALAAQQQTSDEWRIYMGPEFLNTIPGVERVALQGDDASAAGVVQLMTNDQ